MRVNTIGSHYSLVKTRHVDTSSFHPWARVGQCCLSSLLPVLLATTAVTVTCSRQMVSLSSSEAVKFYGDALRGHIIHCDKI